MAGDWMKVEKVTPDKAEVFAIAEKLNIDPDAVFGKCFRVWRWFDDHTTNGKSNGVSVSKLLVDRLVSVSGFADAMVAVGWLIDSDGGVEAKNFDRHNGETAKTRAMTAKRVAKHAAKANEKANAELTHDALPREEKRREEIKPSREPSGFAEFWSAYPKKVGKGAAEKAFKSCRINGHLPDLLTAVEAQKRSEQWQKDGGQFIPNPATWLNQRRWEDDLVGGNAPSGWTPPKTGDTRIHPTYKTPERYIEGTGWVASA